MDAPHPMSDVGGGAPPDAPAPCAGVDLSVEAGLGEARTSRGHPTPARPSTLPVPEPTPTPVPAAPFSPGADPPVAPNAVPPAAPPTTSRGAAGGAAGPRWAAAPAH